MIVDFHSHILPYMDDGSKDVKTTELMLQEEIKQNVDCVIATPHFYASRDNIKTFINRRNESIEMIQNLLDSYQQDIKMYFGAEVAFFERMSQADILDDLTINHTRVLLLELPFIRFNKKIVEEVKTLIEKRHFIIVLAHLERFMIKENMKFIEELLELPLYVQINASSLNDLFKRGKLIKFFKTNKAHLLGSDCHGYDYRPPNLIEGRAVLEKKLGNDILKDIDELSERLLLGGLNNV